MIEFEDISDEQLDEYADSLLDIDRTENERKKSIQDSLLATKQSAEKILSYVNIAGEMVERGEGTTKILTKLSNIARNAAKIGKMSQDVSLTLQPQTENLADAVERMPNIEFRHPDNDVLWIILDELLPHRIYKDGSTGKTQYYYDISAWKRDHQAAFAKEFQNGKFRILNEKAVIIFKFHNNGGGIKTIDADNIDLKPTIDLITLYTLRDDSYEYMSYYVDVVEDERDFTEVIVCPKSKAKEWV